MKDEPTFTIEQMKKEFLCNFVDVRRLYNRAMKSGSDDECEFLHSRMLFYAGLVDLMTRLENSLRGYDK